MIDKYLKTRYVKGARGPDDIDCYGLTRLARHELFGQPLLPLYAGVTMDDKLSITKACGDISASHGFAPVKAVPGAIATGWRVRLCVHVGIVVETDGRLWVLETDVAAGPRLTPPSKFESRYTKVIYYDDTRLS